VCTEKRMANSDSERGAEGGMEWMRQSLRNATSGGDQTQSSWLGFWQQEDPANNGRVFAASSHDLEKLSAKGNTEEVGAAGRWLNRKTKKKVLAVFLVVVVLAIVISTVVMMLNRPDGVTRIDLPGAGNSTQVDVDASTILGIPRSRRGEVTVITEGAGMPQARSYDTRDWEAVLGKAVQCFKKECRFYPTERSILDGFVIISTYVPSYSYTEDRAEAVRFLMQSTYGPSRASIEAFERPPGGVEGWIRNQMEIEPTLHRKFYRQRAGVYLDVVNAEGRPTSPCEAGSRWHQFAFQDADEGLSMTLSDAGTHTVITIDGAVRHHAVGSSPWRSVTGTFEICNVDEAIGGDVEVGTNCDGTTTDYPNEAINFEGTPYGSARLLTVGPESLENVQASVTGVKIFTNGALDCSLSGTLPAFLTDGTNVYLFSPRLYLFNNEVENPVNEEPLQGATCPSAPVNFVNVDGCVASPDACSSVAFTDAFFDLNHENLRKFYGVGTKYVYSIEGLSLELAPSPCDGSSRWLISSGTCGAGSSNGDIDMNTLNTFTTLLRDSFSGDGNTIMRDVAVPNGDPCIDNGNLRGARLDVSHDSQDYCFENVHPHLRNVYDFTVWTLLSTHPGNQAALDGGRPNPIERWAKDGFTELVFPSWHPAQRWEDNVYRFPLLGRLGDNVNFKNLPSSVQTVALGEAFSALPVGTAVAQMSVSCGSPGEVPTSSNLGSMFTFEREGDFINSFDEYIDDDRTQAMVWLNVALNAPDQLRQKVAFGLAKIVVVHDIAVDTSRTEWAATYHDIFVRHAFGNYRDILREVSYSAPMADMLSFRRSRSFAASGTFPDENYAREVMQLFSTGLFKLHLNGTVVRNANGVAIDTYDNEDILEYAKVWTGFDRQPFRSNIEGQYNVGSGQNYIDPMELRGSDRDAFPKLGLDGLYIGDNYPLCEELPEYAFLKKGARYRFLGSSPLPVIQSEPSAMETGDHARLELNPDSSSLFRRLCGAENPDNTDLLECRFKAEVELRVDLSCDEAECEVDEPRVVMLPSRASLCPSGSLLDSSVGTDEGHICVDVSSDAVTCPVGCVSAATPAVCVDAANEANVCRVDTGERAGLFFEYIRPPCVHLSFYKGLEIKEDNQASGACADPRSTFAKAACCSLDVPQDFDARHQCLFEGERMTAARAQERCATQLATEMTLCNFGSVDRGCPFRNVGRFWTNVECDVQAKVAPNGKISVEHNIGGGRADFVDGNEENFFRALWVNGEFPVVDEEGKCNANCSVAQLSGDELGCLCNVDVSSRKVFDRIPTKEDALARLRVGSANPSSFDSKYFSVPASGPDGVKMHRTREGDFINSETVFEVEDRTRRLFFRNVEYTVRVRGSSFEFRNTPSFHNPVELETRDAMHETEAALDHYFYHQSTAPFIAKHLIQHMVNSNPSARYVEVAARAFRDGRYRSFGSGKYGDLGATVAAVLLDAEARNFVVEADPSYGKFQEPIQKLTHIFRALEYEANQKNLVSLRFLEARIGQMPHRAPSVFSFFLPEFSPTGPVAEASLVAPEAQLLTAPLIVSTYNALASFIQYGVTHCEGGLGDFVRDNCFWVRQGRDPAVQGNFTFRPSTQSNSSKVIVDELAVLLTAGRLSSDARKIVQEVYEAEREDKEDENLALRAAERLIVGSAEFNAISQGGVSNTSRSEGSDVNSPNVDAPFKSIVYIFLNGGLDSWNALIPHSGCTSSNGDFNAYSNVRTNLAFTQGELLEITTTDQHCTSFGLNPSLVATQQLYNDGDAVFMSNVGVLVNSLEDRDDDSEWPPSLFAHNAQQYQTQTVREQDFTSSGVMGRMMDSLHTNGFKTATFSLSGGTAFLNGEPGVSPEQDILTSNGLSEFDNPTTEDNFIDYLQKINELRSENRISEHWAKTLVRTLNRTAELNRILSGYDVDPSWTTNTGIGRDMQQVARVLKAREDVGANRNAFFVQLGGFDTHNNLKDTVMDRLTELDEAIDGFVTEMKRQGAWESTTIVVASEFGRTLTSNGLGSDHGWGGNYMAYSGSLNGGKVIGTYPEDITDSSPLQLGRGRLIPTTSWESIWNSIAEWFDVPDEDLDTVLPNRRSFSEKLYRKADLFI